MDTEVVVSPCHNHPKTHIKESRMGKCCGIKYDDISEGYYCAECDFFFHKMCGTVPYKINFSSHTCTVTSLRLPGFHVDRSRCPVCGEKIKKETLHYGCTFCSSGVHMRCVWYPPPEVIDVPQHHHHKLKLEMVESCFTCAACGEDGDGYPYKCHECDLTFHSLCEKYAAEVKHPSHPLHPLKLIIGEPPAYIDEKCRLCGESFEDTGGLYHCSACNFSLNLQCILHPPPLYLHDQNTHEHKLTLFPKLISFTCTVCGLNGDRSPYVCLQCDFVSHNACTGFPWVININRHNHRVSRTSLLGVVNSVCGVCQKKMDWSCGGYACQKCPKSVFHTKCATREDVSDCIEMKDEPEEDEDIEPFEVIDENTILHFSHKKHHLRLDKSGIFLEERRNCEACSYPTYHDPFYSCLSCDFILHESCANAPTRKRHMLSNKPYRLETYPWWHSKCTACGVLFSGFVYKSESNDGNHLDVRCASVSEPFFHQSHPHPLFYTSPRGVCSACKEDASHVFRCVEDDCGYALDFKCALLPYEVKHKVDAHFLSLCYGEDGKKSSGKSWCDICEKETNPKAWFYTSTDRELTLHIDCVLGDFRALEPGKDISGNHFRSVLSKAFQNNSMSRPLCHQCESRCTSSIILKVVSYGERHVVDDNIYFCSMKCFDVHLGR